MPKKTNTLRAFCSRCKALLQRVQWADLLTFFLFVLLATALWYGHAMQSVRNAQITVPVNYTGIPNEVGLQGKGLPETLQVEVRDAGIRLRAYQKEPPQLTIDLSSQTRGNKGTIRISSDVLRRSVTDMLQGTSKLIMVQPEQIVCPYYKQQKRSIPVRWNGTATPAAEYRMVGEPTLSATTVTAYGRSDILDTIAVITTEKPVLSELKDTTHCIVALIAPEGIRLQPDSLCLTVVTERFTEKVMRVPLHVRNVPEGETVRLFPHEVDVTVRVGIAHFADIHEADIVAECDYPAQTADRLRVEVRSLNPYISDLRAYPDEVEFIIEKL
ncbi:MAG: hypothetical protein ACI30A_00445 [Paludibacteraceae bacterium]